MVAQEFFSLLKKFHPSKGTGIEDFSDRFNFHLTVMMLVLCSTIVTVKQYVLKPISCYSANSPGGMNLVNYMEDYCWIHGTNPIGVLERLPQDYSGWKEAEVNKLYYYQWIPFVLGLQALLFYLPRVVWQMVTASGGTSIIHVMSTAAQANTKQQCDREKLITHVAKSFEQMLFHYREYRQGPLANFRRTVHRCCYGFVISKRLGTWLVVWYLIVKVLCLIIGCGQLYLMQTFLGLESKYEFFGYDIAKDVISGRDWQTTKVFPRVTFCHVPLKHLGLRTNGLIAQCVLPVNMLNEKIYIFLWFWIVIGAFITTTSILIWLVRISHLKNNSRFIRKFLKLTEIYSYKEKPIVNNFVTSFLRHDGMFLLRMLSLNAGDLVTSDIVIELWTIYRRRYKHRDFRDDGIDDARKNTIHLENVQLSSGILKPTAPHDAQSITNSIDDLKQQPPDYKLMQI